jgi:acetolactate synthase-1/2/3 large subunit
MDVTPAPMTTAQAAVAALLAHGITAVYALPGVHNDPLFDALFAARDRILHGAYATRGRRRLHGARSRHSRPAAAVYSVVPGPGFLNSPRRC